MGKIAFADLCVSLLCLLFGFVYEQFSHGVWAVGMVYGFIFPLVGGALPFAALALCGRRFPSSAAADCWHAGIAALTLGSLFSGVLTIYGTTNRLLAVYPAVGIPLLIIGALLGILSLRPKR